MKNIDIFNEYVKDIENKTCSSYMLTISRDNEYPIRSIYFYDNALGAAQGYNAYKDWGFAKEFLTVTLYEPNGKINIKTLKRPKGGECVFIRQDYIDVSELILKIKDKINKEDYQRFVLGMAKIFSKDNLRFDEQRFFKKTKYKDD